MGSPITKSISRSWRATETLEVVTVCVNLELLSACDSPFGDARERVIMDAKEAGRALKST